MAKKKTDEQHDAEVHASPAAAQPEVETGRPPKMKRREYEREMRVLHGELVAMQERGSARRDRRSAGPPARTRPGGWQMPAAPP